MNGRMAKKIRKIVYGDKFSSHHREYLDTINVKQIKKEGQTYTRTADVFRRNYKRAKKMYEEILRGKK